MELVSNLDVSQPAHLAHDVPRQHAHLAHDVPRRLLVEITYYDLDPSIPEVLQVLKQTRLSLTFFKSLPFLVNAKSSHL